MKHDTCGVSKTHHKEAHYGHDIHMYIYVYMSPLLPGEISVTSDMQMTPPLWQKVKKN